MALTYHRSVTDDGGAIGVEIGSGVVNALLPEITQDDQLNGATISRKFYIANSGAEDVTISNLSMNGYTVFASILFESTGDTQVAGDLTGSETDESPITVVIPAGGHKSFWVQLDVPAGSTKTDNYGRVDTKSIY